MECYILRILEVKNYINQTPHFTEKNSDPERTLTLGLRQRKEKKTMDF